MKTKSVRKKDENQPWKRRYGDMKKYTSVQGQIIKTQFDDIITSSSMETLDLDYNNSENSDHISWGEIF